MGFESRCSHLSFRFCACFKQGVSWHLDNYTVWVHSETRTWRDKNRQSFFLDLEKSSAIKVQVGTVIYNDKEPNDELEINNHIYSFFNYLYKTLSFCSNNLENHLNTISFPKLIKKVKQMAE